MNTSGLASWEKSSLLQWVTLIVYSCIVPLPSGGSAGLPGTPSSCFQECLDYFAVSATMPENYQAPFDFIRPVIAKAVKMDTDSEKVEYLNDYY